VRVEGKQQDGNGNELPPALAPEFPPELLPELAPLFFNVCAREMQVTMNPDSPSALKPEDWKLVNQLLDSLESLALELAAEAQAMDDAGTAHERRKRPDPPLLVDDASFDGIAHAMFERYQVNGRVDREAFNRIGRDMEGDEAATMPSNIWEKLCEDVDAAAEAGFTFFQFADFFVKTNRHGLALLHAGVYKVDVNSVARRSDWCVPPAVALAVTPPSHTHTRAHTQLVILTHCD
jgi:hypothetical protein